MTPRETYDSHLSPISNHYFPTGLSRSPSCASLRRLWRTLSVISSLFFLFVYSVSLARSLFNRSDENRPTTSGYCKKKEANNARNERETKKDRRYEEKIQRSNWKRERKICSIERRVRYVEILRIDYSAWNVGSQPSGLRVYVSKYFHARGKQWCGDTFLDRKFDKCVAPRNWLLSYPLVRGGY